MLTWFWLQIKLQKQHCALVSRCQNCTCFRSVFHSIKLKWTGELHLAGTSLNKIQSYFDNDVFSSTYASGWITFRARHASTWLIKLAYFLQEWTSRRWTRTTSRSCSGRSTQPSTHWPSPLEMCKCNGIGQLPFHHRFLFLHTIVFLTFFLNLLCGWLSVFFLQCVWLPYGRCREWIGVGAAPD